MSIGPFEFIRENKVVNYPNGESFRFVIYGAYNAMGLIGPEQNGIAILNEKEMNVICDQIGILPSWYHGNTPSTLLKEFVRLTNLSFSEVTKFVNSHPRARYELTR